MRNDTGSTHKEARASRQSKKKRDMAIIVVEMMEPTSSGIQCEEAVSILAQSSMTAFVRSARSRLPKKDKGSFRRCSARDTRRTPLSL